jgi:cell division septation protein DedD
MFIWLISHQAAVLFSRNKSVTSNQPTVLFSQNKPAPATSNQPTVLFSQNKPAPAISHQPTEQAPRLDRIWDVQLTSEGL